MTTPPQADQPSSGGGTTFHLRVWTRYFETPERVWQVKTDPAMLAKELPRGFGLCMANPEVLAQALADGRPCEVPATIGPLRLAWPLRVEAVEPLRRYRDTSENALFSLYEHEHQLEPTPDGTRYIDKLIFRPALPAGKLVAILTQRLFVHRHQVAARHLRADARTIGVSVLRVWDEAETLS
jgi:ligand-binding SRPBCC domain-containing protein